MENTSNLNFQHYTVMAHEAVDALERQIERQVGEAPAVAPPPQELLADAVAEE